MIDYTKRAPARRNTAADDQARSSLAAFIAGGTSDPNRPVRMRDGQNVNLSRLAGQRRT